MARQWFTTLPDKYFMKLNKRGHRNEVLATLVVLGLIHWKVINPILDAKQYRRIDGNFYWQKTRDQSGEFIVSPNEKLKGPTFLAR